MRCAIGACGWPVQEERLCAAHLRRLRQFGHPTADSLSDWDRFISHTKEIDGCLIWIGALNREGYGDSSWGLAHRYAYKQKVGPIPDGMQLDHLCHTRDKSCLGGRDCPHRPCVDWTHLEPVTNRENSARSRAAEINGVLRRSITHCKRGHPLSGSNCRMRKDGSRACRSCDRLRFGRPVDPSLISQGATGE